MIAPHLRCSLDAFDIFIYAANIRIFLSEILYRIPIRFRRRMITLTLHYAINMMIENIMMTRHYFLYTLRYENEERLIPQHFRHYWFHAIELFARNIGFSLSLLFLFSSRHTFIGIEPTPREYAIIELDTSYEVSFNIYEAPPLIAARAFHSHIHFHETTL